MKPQNKFKREEKRGSKRTFNSIEAKLNCGRKNYTCAIENIARNGLLVIVASKKNVTTFIPEAIVRLKFQSSNGKTINLRCEMRWVHINKIPIYGFRYRLGVETINPPIEYKKFLKTLK